MIVSELPDQTLPITVNGVEISSLAIAGEMQYHPADSQQSAYHQASQALVIKELLVQEAARLNITPMNDQTTTETREQALIRRLIERKVETPEADDQSCCLYYQNNRSRFKTPDLIEASHILLIAPKDAIQERRKAKQLAEQLLSRLKEGALFEELAKTNSACPSRENGGSLGQLTSGQTVPEFERQVFSMTEGLAPHPIETRYGYHLVRIDRRIEGRSLDYEHV